MGLGDANKVKLFHLSISMHPNFFVCFAPMERWNFSGNLDHKGSLIHRWLPESIFCRCSQIASQKGQNWFSLLWVAQPVRKSICFYQKHWWGKTSSQSMAYGAESHNSHRGTSVHEWCWSFLAEGVIYFWRCQLFYQQKWVHSGLAENFNWTSKLWQNQRQVHRTKEMKLFYGGEREVEKAVINKKSIGVNCELWSIKASH